jgi:Lon protease-like protein
VNARASWTLALFPLKSVLFPGALLNLKVFEARYLDLIGRCLRESAPFGVVCLETGGELRQATDQPATSFFSEGTLAHIEDVDAEGTNLLRVRCRGGARFGLDAPARQAADGLWLAEVTMVDEDAVALPDPSLLATVQALQQVIASLRAQGTLPFAEPFRLDDAGWVANRWCEILPISLAAKQKLMVLPDPQARLRLVHEYLRGKGVV